MARRERGDWVPCVDYGNSITVTGAAGGTGILGGIILVRHGITSDATNVLSEPGVGIIEPTQLITVHRVVGQINMSMTGADGVAMLRMTKCIYDEDDDTFSSFEDTLNTADDANSPFLWERKLSLNNGDVIMQVFFDPWWSSVDVRVGRNLERDEALFMLLQVQGLAAATLRVTPYLRSWCTIASGA